MLSVPFDSACSDALRPDFWQDLDQIFRKEHPKPIENQCCWSIVGEFQFGGFATTMVLPIATTIALEEILVLEMAMLRSVTSSSSRVSPTRYHRSSSPETMETLQEIPSKNPGKNSAKCQ